MEDLPRGALREIFEVNLFGYHDLARRVIPMMRAQGHGRIVNCSSVLGLVGMTWRGAYVATKFAMEGLSDVMRIEMKGTGIDIILIEPGPIATRIRENAIPHFEKWIDVENSARKEQYASLRGRLYDKKTKEGYIRAGAGSSDRQADPCHRGQTAKGALLCHDADLSDGLCPAHPVDARMLDWLIAKRVRPKDFRKSLQISSKKFGLRFSTFRTPRSGGKGVQPMFSDPLFLFATVACLVSSSAILLFGIGTFAKGGEFNKRNANKIMRWRIGRAVRGGRADRRFRLAAGRGGKPWLSCRKSIPRPAMQGRNRAWQRRSGGQAQLARLGLWHGG